LDVNLCIRLGLRVGSCKKKVRQTVTIKVYKSCGVRNRQLVCCVRDCTLLRIILDDKLREKGLKAEHVRVN
jgi:hypothetical protein